MIFEPKIFYQAYQQDYHKIKATYLKKMLDDLSKFKIEIFEKTVTAEERKSLKRVLMSDLRQTYFHSIETFFELFFALNPKGKKYYDDEFILLKLTNSDFRKNYKKIGDIAQNKNSLDFLDERMTFLGFDITIGQYIFYMGIFNKEKFPQEVFDLIKESIEALKYGIRIIANDFLKREEYNAYKHGLRTISAAKELIISKSLTEIQGIKFDLSDSMSYYSKTNNINELKIVTTIFDPMRDYKMILLCSHMIHHMIEYRKISMNKNNSKKNEKFPITFFDKNEIDKCNKVNVKIQDLIYTVRKKKD